MRKEAIDKKTNSQLPAGDTPSQTGITGNGGLDSLSDPAASDPARFDKVEVEIPEDASGQAENEP